MKKIAYCIRKNYMEGGDGVQAVKTKAYVENMYKDVQIDIIDDVDMLTEKYDLVHIFNYATPDFTTPYFNKAEELGLKVVSSPVYWDYSFSTTPLPLIRRFNKNFITERYVKLHRLINGFLSNLPIPQLQKAYFNISNSFSNQIRRYVADSALILPNSKEEGELCCDFAQYPEGKSKIRVVYNGVDLNGVSTLSEEDFFAKYKLPKNYVLQVGRMEYLKNPLNLLGALMEDRDIPIVFLGNMRCSINYIKKIKELADIRGNVYFVENVPHDEVYSFYRYAGTHVLLSMRESPGLVSLEALSQGCPIVVSDKRFLPVDTYFSELFESVNPFSKKEIRDAVLKSLKKKHYVVDLNKFSWTEVAKQTYKAYMEIL